MSVISETGAPDALHVRCEKCGAWCRAVAAAEVGCAHCGASVPVPEDVRLFIETIAKFEPVRDVLDPHIPKVEASCAQCGHPMRYGDAEKERCPACGAESVAPTAGTVQILLGGLQGGRAFHQKVRQQALEMFPVAKRVGDTFQCGDCSAVLRASSSTCERCGKSNQPSETMSLVALYRVGEEESARTRDRERKLGEIREQIAGIERLEAQILASRPPLWPVLVRFALVFLGIALFCYVGYRIEIAFQ